MIDRRPTDFADMQQPIGPADIDKGTEGTQVAYFAFQHVADFERVEEYFAPLIAVFAFGQHLRHHQSPSATINLDHLEAQ